jgi:hypothetical protein
MSIRTSLVLAVALLGAVPSHLYSDDSTPAASATVADDLIRQLSSEDFGERRAAREALLELGAAAIEPMVTALETADEQLAGECVQLLRRLSASEDPAVEALAISALVQLAESENANVAEIAGGAIQPDAPPPGAQGPGNFPAIQIQINGQAWQPGAGQFFQNGKQELEVEDDGRKVKITSMRGGPITVTITEEVDGKPVVTEVKAGNAAELHQKSPEAFELYRKHVLMARPQQIGGPIGIAQGFAAPPGFGPPPGFGGPPIGLQFGGGNFKFENVSTSNVTGQRIIDVSSNDLTLHIEDFEGSDIHMDITETIEGETKSRAVDADDLDALREKDEAAAELYEKYTGGRRAGRGFGFEGNIQIEP